ncbi:hypothetical protein [Aristophania vespae]|uniref:hypothetical protein n=1 Tax=Aristophania vespae TaxID=2697033 RepID=UPI00235189AA|nr:hypothetical protein [Aristophania vespae]
MAFVPASLSLLTLNAELQALCVGCALFCHALQRENSCPISYMIMALLLLGLYPAFWSVCLVLPVLFWPDHYRKENQAHYDLSYILLVGLALKIGANEVQYWLISVIILFIIIILWTIYNRLENNIVFLLNSVSIIRSILLTGILHEAISAHSYIAAQAAIYALLIDVTCQICTRWGGKWRSLRLIVPPLPGFVALWFGINATLAMSNETGEGIVLSLSLALILGLCSLAESCLTALTLPKLCLEWAFIGKAALFLCVVTIMAIVLGPQYDSHMSLSLSHIRTWFFAVQNQQYLAFPALWMFIMTIWFCCVSPRFKIKKPPISLSVSEMFRAELSIFLMPHFNMKFFVKRPWQRLFVLFLKQCQPRFLMAKLEEKKISSFTLPIWLFFLGSMLAMVGFAS